ncbi:MAG: catechol 2,3-dioxygenase-like lactoylglutathione lyase family enzyme [Gammaproteobacteria bacterium]|jgi:catechol 2,3-dioxygenase-like lactoylglutathione lyase family enzyme
MIRLEHINLVVTNISKTKKFLETAMPHWKVRGSGQNEWYGKKRNWLHFGDDDYYITLNDHGEGVNRDLRGSTPGLAHIGFVVDDLDSIVKRLTEKGYEIATIGATHPHRKTIYFIDPAGYEFEFIQYFSEKAEEKNMYGGEIDSIKRESTK